MKNIIFSTTCQWNPGDEFILHGVINILRASGLQFNPLLWNRNPVVNPRPTPAAHSGIDKDEVFWENSFDVTNPCPADYIVFAGTPEWSGSPRVTPLLEFAKKNNLRCSFLGVGCSAPELATPLVADILRNHTDVFVARDKLAFDVAAPHTKAQMTTCPSILCSPTERVRSKLTKIGCGIQGTRMKWHSVPQAQQDVLYAAYKRLAEKYNVEYVGHYIDDLTGAPAGRSHYSGITHDFYSIYDQFDLVITPRLHGCGISASLGVPSICLAHDQRGVAAELFGSVLINSPEGVDKIVEQHNWPERSGKVIGRKYAARSFYSEAIKPLLDRI